MADNITVKNATGQTLTVRATDNAGVLTTHNIVEVLTTAAGLGKAEDAAHASGDTGVAVLAARRDTRAVGSGTDGDYSTLNVDAQGNLYTVNSEKRAKFSATPTVSSSPAYSANDVIGALLTFANAARFSGGSGVIENILITDKAGVITDVDLILFAANPSASTFTDNAAFTINDTDIVSLIAAVNVANSFAASASSFLQYTPPAGLPFVLGSTSLYGVLVARAGFTFASTSDITVILTIRQD